MKKVLLIVGLVVVVAAALWYFLYYAPAQEALNEAEEGLKQLQNMY